MAIARKISPSHAFALRLFITSHALISGLAGDSRGVHLLSFATGGVGFVVPFGLLVAGVCIIAWFTKMLPRWLVWLGLGVAVIAELSTVSLVFTPATYLLPAT